VSAIAINWHPMSELVELLEVAERILGRSDGRLAEQIGAAGARANLKGVMVRMAFYVGKPEYLLQRITGLWRQFNDHGDMKLLELTESIVRVEVVDVPEPHWLFCCVLTGWCREVAAAVAIEGARARHVECRARGGARCIWEVRGSRRSLGESGGEGQPPPPASSGTFRTPPK
jgi:hypothetical protein